MKKYQVYEARERVREDGMKEASIFQGGDKDSILLTTYGDVDPYALHKDKSTAIAWLMNELCEQGKGRIVACLPRGATDDERVFCFLVVELMQQPAEDCGCPHGFCYCDLQGG